MKKVYGFSISLVLGLSVYFLYYKNMITTSASILVLVFMLVFSIPIIKKIVLPKTKELGIGSLDFYPNLFKRIFK